MLEKIFEETELIDVVGIIIASLAIVSFWRGVWGLLDIYLFPANKILSCIASILIGLLILLAIASYKSKKHS